MQSKELFLKDKELAAKWAGTKDLLERVLIFARGEFMQSGPSREALVGAEYFIHVLQSLSDNEDVSFEFPNPGLFHDVDRMPDKPK